VHTSPSFEKLLAYTGFNRRTQQDALMSKLCADRDNPVFIQAGTGVGKSFAILSRAADTGTPGRPAVVASVTNSLLNQYVDKDLPRVAEATGVTFVRVLGGSNYVCADSPAGRFSGIDRSSRESRERWLDSYSKSDNWATKGELRAEGVDESFACPGTGVCKGGMRAWSCPESGCPDRCECKGAHRADETFGGCASKRARLRAHQVNIVLTNFHFLYYHQYLIERQITELLPPWSDLLIDEAHHLPDTIRDLQTRTITDGTGSKVFLPDPESPVVIPEELAMKLIKATHGVVKFTTEVRKPWGKWDTERPINTARTANEVAFLRKYRTKIDEINEEAGGVDTLHALSTLAELAEGPGGPQKWAALHGEENPGEIRMIPVTAHEPFIARMVGAGALVTGTAGDTLPRRCGVYDKTVKVQDVGHPFNYATQVRGWISQHSGVKSNADDSDTVRARLAEVAAFTAGHPSLILCTSHADASLIARALDRRTHPAVLTQPREGGSIAANETAGHYRQWVEAGTPATLIGTASFATGLDLPGDLLTRLVLWSFVGMTDHVAEQMNRRYRGYVEEQRHMRVVQSVGRLIRTESDRGEVLVADCRFWDLLRRVRKYESVLDRHLLDIPWQKVPQ
jgi:Rad3-related DNA helicase